MYPLLWLVSSNNFYYCRYTHLQDAYHWLVSSNNFYYCRFDTNDTEKAKG